MELKVGQVFRTRADFTVTILNVGALRVQSLWVGTTLNKVWWDKRIDIEDCMEDWTFIKSLNKKLTLRRVTNAT